MKWKLFRIIVPKFPHINIYTRVAKYTTDCGSVMLGSVAKMQWGWRVEIINENNYRGPKNKRGMPDHEALQRENPADVVGFCCGLTCTIERVWHLARYYKSMDVVTIAGGWHAHYCPEETLRHHIDLVAHGDGEPVIGAILKNVAEKKLPHTDVTGCSFLSGGRVLHKDQTGKTIAQITDTDENLAGLRNEVQDLDDLPFPDFGLLKFARMRWYPVSRNRGCKYNCEYCSVRGGIRSASAQHLFETICWLVQTRLAKKFFIVDDLLEGDLPETMKFLEMISWKFGKSLNFLVQVRLDSAKNTEFVQAMADAGVRTVCIGYESPSDQDLKAMHKGMRSSEMLEWTKTLGRHFWIHAMCIFGYPSENAENQIGAEKLFAQFKEFFRKVIKLSRQGFSIQVLKAVPIVGTKLRRRLEKDKVLFPPKVMPWRYYDGNYVCFMPKNMSLKEFQETPTKIMDWFYSPLTFLKVSLKTLLFPFDYILRGWHAWKRDWHKDVVRYLGSRLMKRWREKHSSQKLTAQLEKYWENKK